MIPAPTKSALARLIALRDRLYRKWAARRTAPLTDRERGFVVALSNAIGNHFYGSAKPRPKNPRRVEGGKKLAITRKRRRELAQVQAQIAARAADVTP